MDGSTHKTRFFIAAFGFTATVMALVAADHLILFGFLWMVMGLVMAELIGTVERWNQAQAAKTVARKYFLASTLLLGVALIALWWTTGAATITGVGVAAGTLGGPVWLLAVGALVVAAMVQSALIPFHGWLLSSMTTPTPASALMHAGFVNAGGILLVRFAPVITINSMLMLAVVALGAMSAGGGKLLKSVQTDIKGKLGCSTVGQMGFMIMQAGLGFFGAAITHLILHGFYKAYQFLSSGEQVEHTTPSKNTEHTIGRLTNLAGFGVALLTGPRELTSGCDFNGRIFLHSYDWSTDPDGDALEAIFTGPMIVTQWINTQYYFSTVDNAVYGSGSKVTQNPVGNVGVYQGNGGDLMTGLPLQSLMTTDDKLYHQPLRLSTVVQAPVERVTDILTEHTELIQMLDNNWLSLTVVDPTQDHYAFHYQESLEWIPVTEQIKVPPEIPNAQTVADD